MMASCCILDPAKMRYVWQILFYYIVNYNTLPVAASVDREMYLLTHCQSSLGFSLSLSFLVSSLIVPFPLLLNRGVACYFFLACLFQGLSLLMFRSNICSDPGFFSIYLTGTSAGDASGIVESVSCGLSTGSKLAISATVLYFVCNSIVPMCIPPGPFYTTEAEQQRMAVPQSEPQPES